MAGAVVPQKKHTAAKASHGNARCFSTGGVLAPERRLTRGLTRCSFVADDRSTGYVETFGLAVCDGFRRAFPSPAAE